MPVSAVTRTSLVDEVVSELQQLIEADNLQAGDRLPTEAKLAAQLQVSRNVLREAIRQLAATGLISVRRGNGMFVAKPEKLVSCAQLIRNAFAISPRDLEQFTDFRTAIETHVAAQAARCATPEQIADLEDLCDRMDRMDESYEGAIESDFAFHRMLIEITGNPITLTVMTVMQEFFLATMAKTTPKPRDRQVSQQLHRAILEAVRKGDVGESRRAMQQHMSVTYERMQRALEQGSGDGDEL